MGSGEMPIERRDSWFSPKGIEVPPRTGSLRRTGGHPGGSVLDRRGGDLLTNPNQTTNARGDGAGVRLWVLRPRVERGTAQTAG